MMECARTYRSDFMREKKTSVLRVPDELLLRIEKYKTALSKNGITNISRVDVMRNFAENAITPYDNVSDALKTIGRYPIRK